MTYEERHQLALRMGGKEKLERRRAAGILNARERIDYLADPGSFIESGLFGASAVSAADREKTPADGKVTGYARIAGREVAVVSNDFTVMGASSSATNGRKIAHMKRVATGRGLPIVFLGESSGARMPDTMGSRGMGTMLGNDPTQYQRMRETPWVAAVLGHCYGSSTWYTCLCDFAVMRKGAVMAVSSPHLVSMAMKEEVDPEELGGSNLHAETTGLIDLGFMVGVQVEAAATLREGMRSVYVGLQTTVPVFTVVIRKCYGMAGMATTDKNGLDFKIAWPSAEWGSLPIEGGVAAAFRRQIQSAPDPQQRERELEAELRAFASPLFTAEAFGVEDVIDPRDTREYLCRFLAAAHTRLKVHAGPKAKTGVRP